MEIMMNNKEKMDNLSPRGGNNNDNDDGDSLTPDTTLTPTPTTDAVALSEPPPPSSSQQPIQQPSSSSSSICCGTCCNINDTKVSYQQTYRPSVLYWLSFVVVSTCGGLVYGFPALRRYYLEEQDATDNNTLSERDLGVIFAVGSWSTQGGRFFFGIARDKFGTRKVLVTSLICVVCGSIGIALSNTSNVVALSISLGVIGLGSGSQLCTQPVAALFPTKMGIVTSSLSGAFQISGLVFLALTSSSGASSQGTSHRISFLIFAGVIAILCVISAFLFPVSSSFLLDNDDENDNGNDTIDQEQPGENDKNNNGGDARKQMDKTTSLSVDRIGLDDDDPTNSHNHNNNHHNDNSRMMMVVTMEDDTLDEQEEIETNLTIQIEKSPQHLYRETESKYEKDHHHHPGIPVDIESSDCDIHGNNNNDDANNEVPPKATTTTTTTLIQHLQTTEYILLLIWFTICLIPMQYYIAVIGYLLEQKGDTDGYYTDMFAYVYAGAAICSPFVGAISDICGLAVAQFLATSSVACSFFILASNSSLQIQTIGFVLYSIGRLSIFGYYFDNLGKRQGYTHFGFLAGLGLLLSAIGSLFQIVLIDLATSSTSSDDGNSAYVVNLTIGIVLMLQFPYFMYLSWRERHYKFATTTSDDDQVVCIRRTTSK